MYRSLALGMSLLLVGCASHDTAPDDSSTPAAGAATTAASLSRIKDVDVSRLPTDTGFKCERVVPTGSHIAEQRCHFEDPQRKAMERRRALEHIDAVREQQRRGQEEWRRAVARHLLRDAKRRHMHPGR